LLANSVYFFRSYAPIDFDSLGEVSVSVRLGIRDEPLFTFRGFSGLFFGFLVGLGPRSSYLPDNTF